MDPVFLVAGQFLDRQLGFSFKTNQPVGDIIVQRFPATLQLFVPALTLVCAILLGVISTLRRGTETDYVVTAISYFGIAMPVFLLVLFDPTFRSHQFLLRA